MPKKSLITSLPKLRVGLEKYKTLIIGTKTIEIEGVKFVLKGITWEQALEIGEVAKTDPKKSTTMFLEAGIIEPKEILDKIDTLKPGIIHKLVTEIIELSGLGELTTGRSFLEPKKEEVSST